MAIVAKASNPFGEAVCESLGIDPRDVTEMNFHSKVGALEKLEIKYFITKEQDKSMSEVVKHFRFEPID